MNAKLGIDSSSIGTAQYHLVALRLVNFLALPSCQRHQLNHHYAEPYKDRESFSHLIFENRPQYV